MWRLGSVPYLNALPLVEGLADDPAVELVQELPRRLAPRLRAGELDLALVSAVELFRDPPLGWIAGPAVTSEGAVRSILLFLRTPLAEVRSLALDTSSLSAAAMSQVCLRRFVGLEELALRDAPPDAPLDTLDADAVLRIGDPALATPPGDRDVVDLGALWTEHTGLPFVYALWLARPDVDGAAVAPLLEAARRRGLARRRLLADGFAAAHGLPVADCRDYLDRCIGYALGARELEGLRTYGRLAHELGLVDRPTLPPALERAGGPG